MLDNLKKVYHSIRNITMARDIMDAGDDLTVTALRENEKTYIRFRGETTDWSWETDEALNYLDALSSEAELTSWREKRRAIRSFYDTIRNEIWEGQQHGTPSAVAADTYLKMMDEVRIAFEERERKRESGGRKF